MSNRKIILIVIVIILAVSVGSIYLVFNDKQKSDVEYESLFPTINKSEHLYIIEQKHIMSEEVLLMLESLQGIVAQEKAQIYILRDQEASRMWLEEIIENEKVSVEYIDSPWELVKQFKAYITDNGFVVYKSNTPSINVACTVAGVEKYLAVGESLISEALDFGLVMMEDVRDKDEIWAYRKYKDQINKKVIVSQPYDNYAFRDFGVATKSLFFYDDDSENVFEVYSHMDINAVVMGWYRDELTGVDIASMLEKITIAADHAYNLSVYTSFDSGDFKQKEMRQYGIDSKNVHYVTFMLSDGDNVQWYTNGMLLDQKYYNSPYRGEFPAGWSIPPTLVDLAPVIMNYAYTNQTENDQFVAGVSGVGYINPSGYDEEALYEYAKITSQYMEKADLHYMQILDGGIDSKVIETFAQFKQIQGGFYMIGNRYIEGNGDIKWANNKPFVAYKEALWSEDVEKLANRINGYEKNAESKNGYTAVNVHPWTHTWDAVKAVIDLLGDDVIVVSPGEFMDLIKENLKH